MLRSSVTWESGRVTGSAMMEAVMGSTNSSGGSGSLAPLSAASWALRHQQQQ